MTPISTTQSTHASKAADVEIARLETEIARYGDLVQRRPNTYRPKLAEALFAQACEYLETGDQRSAERKALEAIDQYDCYSGRKSWVIHRKFAIMQWLIGHYNRTKQLEQSERMLLRLLAMQQTLFNRNAMLYGENVAVTQWQLGNLYTDLSRFGEAEQMYRSALETRSAFDDEDIHRYKPATAQCWRSLGSLYEVHLHDNTKAEICYQHAIEIGRTLCENPYERCNHLRGLIRSLDYMRDLYERTGEETKARACNDEMQTWMAELEE